MLVHRPNCSELGSNERLNLIARPSRYLIFRTIGLEAYMKEEINIRLNGSEYIIHSPLHNAGLLRYLTFELHDEPFSLFNNDALYWIWRQTMENQLLLALLTMNRRKVPPPQRLDEFYRTRLALIRKDPSRDFASAYTRTSKSACI